MGLFSDLLGVAAPIAGSFLGGPLGGAIGSALGGAVAGAGGSRQSGVQQTTQQQQLDPRMQDILFGTGPDNKGILGAFGNLLGAPQSLGSGAAANLSSNYLAGALPDDVTAIRNASLGLLDKKNAPNFNAPQFNNPMMITPPNVTAAKINAPGQNAVDLTGAFQNTIYGNPAENKYLKDALQSGIDQSTQAFNTQLGSITDNLQRSILPGIRGNAIAAGQYGGSRQGIAEGLALSDASKQATNAAEQIAKANITATTGAQANAFESGQNRALSALQGLSGQQYGVATRNAELQQQANLANQAANVQALLANQASGNQAALANQGAVLDTNRLNAGNILATNNQNTASTIAGLGSLQGLGNQMYGYNQNAQNADLARAQGIANVYAPFVGANSSTTSTQPLYQNTGANILGGAAAGLGIYGQFKNLFGSGTSGTGGNFGAGLPTGMTGAFGTGY